MIKATNKTRSLGILSRTRVLSLSRHHSDNGAGCVGRGLTPSDGRPCRVSIRAGSPGAGHVGRPAAKDAARFFATRNRTGRARGGQPREQGNWGWRGEGLEMTAERRPMMSQPPHRRLAAEPVCVSQLHVVWIWENANSGRGTVRKTNESQSARHRGTRRKGESAAGPCGAREGDGLRQVQLSAPSHLS